MSSHPPSPPSFDLSVALDYISALNPAEQPIAEAHDSIGGDPVQPSVGAHVAALLQLLVAVRRPKRVLEIGTGLGYAACVLGQAVKAYGGQVITVELNGERAECARRNIARAWLDGTVEVINGEAMAVVSSLSGPFGLILQDGDKCEYGTMLERLVELLEEGGMLISDDVLFPVMALPEGATVWQEAIATYNRMLSHSAVLQTVWLPVGDGISISLKRDETLPTAEPKERSHGVSVLDTGHPTPRDSVWALETVTADVNALDKFLAPTEFIESDAPNIISLAQDCRGADDVATAQALFGWVRDNIRYDPWASLDGRELYRATAILARGSGYCVQKAVLLTALARAAGIPARLGFADVRNHKMPARLFEAMGTNLFVYHGYTEIYVDGRWLKASPAFDGRASAKAGVLPVELDGVNDALLHPVDPIGQRFIEYVEHRGSYADLPLAEIMAEFRSTYRDLRRRSLRAGDVTESS